MAFLSATATPKKGLAPLSSELAKETEILAGAIKRDSCKLGALPALGPISPQKPSLDNSNTLPPVTQTATYLRPTEQSGDTPVVPGSTADTQLIQFQKWNAEPKVNPRGLGIVNTTNQSICQTVGVPETVVNQDSFLQSRPALHTYQTSKTDFSSHWQDSTKTGQRISPEKNPHAAKFPGKGQKVSKRQKIHLNDHQQSTTDDPTQQSAGDFSKLLLSILENVDGSLSFDVRLGSQFLSRGGQRSDQENTSAELVLQQIAEGIYPKILSVLNTSVGFLSRRGGSMVQKSKSSKATILLSEEAEEPTFGMTAEIDPTFMMNRGRERTQEETFCAIETLCALTHEYFCPEVLNILLSGTNPRKFTFEQKLDSGSLTISVTKDGISEVTVKMLVSEDFIEALGNEEKADSVVENFVKFLNGPYYKAILRKVFRMDLADDIADDACTLQDLEVVKQQAENAIGQMKKELNDSRAMVDDQTAIISSNREEISNLLRVQSKLRSELDEKVTILQSMEASVCELNTNKAELEEALQSKEDGLEDLKTELSGMRMEFDQRQEELESKADLLQEQEDAIAALEEQKGVLETSHRKEVEKDKELLEEKNAIISGLRKELEETAGLNKGDNHIHDLEEKVGEYEREIKLKEEQLADLHQKIENFESELKQSVEKYEEKEEILKGNTRLISYLKEKGASNEVFINKYKMKIEELEKTLSMTEMDNKVKSHDIQLLKSKIETDEKLLEAKEIIITQLQQVKTKNTALIADQKEALEKERWSLGEVKKELSQATEKLKQQEMNLEGRSKSGDNPQMEPGLEESNKQDVEGSAVKSKMTELCSNVAELEAERNELKNKLEMSEMKTEACDIVISDLKRQLNEERGIIRSVNHEGCADVKTHFKEMTNDINTKHTTNTYLQGQLKEETSLGAHYRKKSSDHPARCIGIYSSDSDCVLSEEENKTDVQDQRLQMFKLQSQVNSGILENSLLKQKLKEVTNQLEASQRNTTHSQSLRQPDKGGAHPPIIVQESLLGTSPLQNVNQAVMTLPLSVSDLSSYTTSDDVAESYNQDMYKTNVQRRMFENRVSGLNSKVEFLKKERAAVKDAFLLEQMEKSHVTSRENQLHLVNAFYKELNAKQTTEMDNLERMLIQEQQKTKEAIQRLHRCQRHYKRQQKKWHSQWNEERIILVQEASKLQDECRGLRAAEQHQRVTHETSLEALQKKLNILEHDYKLLQVEYETTKGTLQAQVDQQRDEYKNLRLSAEAEKDKLEIQQERDSAENTAKRVAAEAKWQYLQQEVEDLRVENKQLSLSTKLQVESMKRELDQEKRENYVLRSKLRQTVHFYKNQLEQQKRGVDLERSDNESTLQKQKAEVERHKSILERVRMSLISSESEKNILRQEFERLEEESRKTRKDLERKLQALQQEMDQERNEKEAIRSSAEKNSERLQLQLKEQWLKIEHLRENLERKTEEMEKCQQNEVSLEATNRALMSDVQEVRGQVKQELQFAKDICLQKEREIQDLKDENQSLADMNVRVKQDVETLIVALSAERRVTATMAERYDNIVCQNEDLMSSLDEVGLKLDRSARVGVFDERENERHSSFAFHSPEAIDQVNNLRNVYHLYESINAAENPIYNE